jgi:hypothetical protein
VSFLAQAAAAALVTTLLLCIVLAVAGCGPDAGRVYCPTTHGETCAPSPTVHPSP